MNKNEFDIDLVYLWVDGSDPAWIARKNAFLGEVETGSDINCKGRYENNDELKYSLRSVQKHIPWVRKIFIVTDNQIPGWLDISHPKIKIIDHKEILPAEALPCYNSVVIEHCLHKISGLSEYFLYANDDMFFNTPLNEGSFFTEEGYPVVRLFRKRLGRYRHKWKDMTGKDMSYHRQAIHDSALLIEKMTGVFYSGIPHHNVDAYNKTDYRHAVEVVFKDLIKDSLSHHLRTPGDLQRAVFSYLALATGHAQLMYVTTSESRKIEIHREYRSRFAALNPALFCLNDNDHATDSDRIRAKHFLEELFPDKSDFEK